MEKGVERKSLVLYEESQNLSVYVSEVFGTTEAKLAIGNSIHTWYQSCLHVSESRPNVLGISPSSDFFLSAGVKSLTFSQHGVEMNAPEPSRDGVFQVVSDGDWTTTGARATFPSGGGLSVCIRWRPGSDMTEVSSSLLARLSKEFPGQETGELAIFSTTGDLLSGIALTVKLTRDESSQTTVEDRGDYLLTIGSEVIIHNNSAITFLVKQKLVLYTTKYQPSLLTSS